MVIELLDKALRHSDLLHFHLQWQLSLGAPHLDAGHKATHLVLPAASYENPSPITAGASLAKLPSPSPGS